MKLAEAVAQYIEYKQSMGMRFHTEARTLRSFCRTVGDVAVADIKADGVYAYIAGSGPVTRFWHRKHEALSGFYRFAIGRGYTDVSLLPKLVPKPPLAFVPYIYSRNEIRRLLDAATICESPRSKLQPHTCRMLILLLYGAGLRISEALALTLADVDLTAAILTIRESKFYKTRFVPIGPDLTGALAAYAARRSTDYSADPEASFFVSRTGISLTRRIAEDMFRQLCARAGVKRDDGGRFQPRLHDLRHAFAVHRVVTWYQRGADVQHLLPQLATYLGHVHIAATQRYLTMTPELLREASRRFERYALEGHHE